nr:hypothetical protein MarFTME_052 [Marseillevirus futianmevirus]
MTDWDNKIAFWLKNVPYLWVKNRDWKKCKRVYLVSPDTEAFDAKGRKESLQTFWEERVPFYRGVSLVSNCNEGVSNYFLASVPPAKKRGLEWWAAQPGFPFKDFEIRMEGTKFSGDLRFRYVSRLDVVRKKKKYSTRTVPKKAIENKIRLEDLPDEVLSMIAENSPGAGFGLANKRLFGIWKEKNDLEKLILKKDKKAGDPKFSDAFGYKEIKMCVDSGFLYPLKKQLASWLKKGVGAKKCDPEKLLPVFISMRLQGRKLLVPFALEESAKEAGYPQEGLECLYYAASFGVGETIGSAPKSQQRGLLKKFGERDIHETGRKDWLIAGIFFAISRKFEQEKVLSVGELISDELVEFFNDTIQDDWVVAEAVVEKTNKKFWKQTKDFFEEERYIWLRLFQPDQNLNSSSQRLLKYLTDEEHPARKFIPGGLRLEDLPDEVLSLIAENSPGPGFGLANKRLAGIWKEGNNLRRMILRKDKRAGDPKFSNMFGEDEIQLCLNTEFLYPIKENMYGKWTNKRVMYYSPSFILFGKVLGKRQELPPIRSIATTKGYHTEHKIPDLGELFGEEKKDVSKKYLENLDNFKYYISFGFGQRIAKNQNKRRTGQYISTFSQRKKYLDSWFLAGYAFENRNKNIDWEKDLPKRVQKQLKREAEHLHYYGEGISSWTIPFYTLRSIGKEKNLESLTKYLVANGLVPQQKMAKYQEHWEEWIFSKKHKHAIKILVESSK